MTTVYPIDYNIKMQEYNRMVLELEEQRKKFYEENPNFPLKYMYVNVIAPPQKLIIIDC